MPEDVYCEFLLGVCGYPYTECPLQTQPEECPKMPVEEEEGEGEPPGGPG